MVKIKIEIEYDDMQWKCDGCIRHIADNVQEVILSHLKEIAKTSSSEQHSSTDS